MTRLAATSPAVPHPALGEADYFARTSALLAQVEATVDGWLQADVADIDTRRSGNLLELSFANGSKIILNTQPPLRELWMAARRGGFHYRFAGGRWVDREGAEFLQTLSQCVSEQAGQALHFAPVGPPAPGPAA